MFRVQELIISRSKLHHTASGIITPISVMIPEADDEHMCSKHVEALNKLIVKQKCCASRWLITEIKFHCKLIPERILGITKSNGTRNEISILLTFQASMAVRIIFFYSM